jgi:hypothetical protein
MEDAAIALLVIYLLLVIGLVIGSMMAVYLASSSSSLRWGVADLFLASIVIILLSHLQLTTGYWTGSGCPKIYECKGPVIESLGSLASFFIPFAFAAGVALSIAICSTSTLAGVRRFFKQPRGMAALLLVWSGLALMLFGLAHVKSIDSGGPPDIELSVMQVWAAVAVGLLLMMRALLVARRRSAPETLADTDRDS